MESKGRTPIKKNVFFRALPEMGGGETPAQIFYFFSTMLSLIFWHQYHVMWYFLVIFNTKIIKSTKIIITIITHIIVVIIVTWFCNTRKNVVFDVQKKLYNLPELGGGGGRGNLGNARKKSIFLMWGLPLFYPDTIVQSWIDFGNFHSGGVWVGWYGDVEKKPFR